MIVLGLSLKLGFVGVKSTKHQVNEIKYNLSCFDLHTVYFTFEHSEHIFCMKNIKKLLSAKKTFWTLSMVQIQMYISTNPCCFANFETWQKYMLDLDHISIITDIEEHQPFCKI